MRDDSAKAPECRLYFGRDLVIRLLGHPIDHAAQARYIERVREWQRQNNRPSEEGRHA